MSMGGGGGGIGVNEDSRRYTKYLFKKRWDESFMDNKCDWNVLEILRQKYFLSKQSAYILLLDV
jgi:hypothetical protein